MKKVMLFLVCFILLMVGCARKTIDVASDKTSDKTSISTNYVTRDYVEKVKLQTIDSMLKVKLPIEQSHSVIAKPHQVSHLKTSLAISDAYVDSAGYLNHTLYNRDSASLPMKYIINNITITKHDTIVKTDTLKVKISSNTSTKTTVQKHKIFENFFYYSGLFLYLIAIGYGVYKLYAKGKLTIIQTLFKRCLNAVRTLFKR